MFSYHETDRHGVCISPAPVNVAAGLLEPLRSTGGSTGRLGGGRRPGQVR